MLAVFHSFFVSYFLFVYLPVPLFLSFCVSIFLSISLSVHLSISLFVYLSVLSVYLSISVYLAICLSVFLNIRVFHSPLCFCLSLDFLPFLFCLTASLSVCPTAYFLSLSVFLPFHLSCTFLSFFCLFIFSSFHLCMFPFSCCRSSLFVHFFHLLIRYFLHSFISSSQFFFNPIFHSFPARVSRGYT